jgi:predicted anti-sigma-YlaC factor YlaD
VVVKEVIRNMHLTNNGRARYLDGTATESERAVVATHLRTCSLCCEVLAAENAAADRWERRGLLRRLTRVAPPQVDALAPTLRRAA